MNDTSPEMEEKMCEMIMQKTPLERLKMGCSMYETSKFFVIRFILEENPNISDEDLRQEFFLKFYGDDFNEEQKKKICEYLKRNTVPGWLKTHFQDR